MSLAPRGIVNHYFDVRLIQPLYVSLADCSIQETIDSHSEYGAETPSVFSAYSAADMNTLGDISPDAL